MKQFLIGLSLLLSVGFSAPKAEAVIIGGTYFTGIGINYAGWGWYPLGLNGWWPYYGYSYWPYYDFAVYYATYGAISISKSTGAVGVSFRHDSREGAFNDANGYCGSEDCRPVVWVQGGCGAIAATADKAAFGWGVATSKYAARSRAMRGCKASGGKKDCRIAAWVCSW